MPAVPSRHNPFEFGGELKASAPIDREQELDLVIRTIENGGKLFLIGPRRYGKTSISGLRPNSNLRWTTISRIRP